MAEAKKAEQPRQTADHKVPSQDVVISGRPLAPAPEPIATRPHRMKANAVNHFGAQPGDIVELTDAQSAAWRDKFEPVDSEVAMNHSRFPGEAKDEQGSAHGAQGVPTGARPAAPPPPLTAKDTPLPPPFGARQVVVVSQPPPEEGRKEGDLTERVDEGPVHHLAGGTVTHAPTSNTPAEAEKQVPGPSARPHPSTTEPAVAQPKTDSPKTDNPKTEGKK